MFMQMSLFGSQQVKECVWCNLVGQSFTMMRGSGMMRTGNNSAQQFTGLCPKS